MANQEHSRKSVAVSRLKKKLRKNRESLSDQFEYKMFIIINFNKAVRNQL